MDVVVEYEYAATEEDELSLRVGEIIHNVHKQSGGWWEGELNGKRGVFPDNFVKELKKDKPSRDMSKKSSSGGGSHVASMAEQLNKGMKMGPPAGMRRPHGGGDSQSRKKLRAKVTYSYDPTNDDELHLEVGQVVEILKQEEEGWWEGNIDGRVGLFPSNFVQIQEEKEIIAEPDEKQNHANDDLVDVPPTIEVKLPSDEEPQQIQGKKVKGVGLGNIFGDGPIKLRKGDSVVKKSDEDKPISDRQSLRKAAPPPLPKDPPIVPPKDPPEHKQPTRARALYSYTAENDDELSLEEGDIITILDTELEDSGWWKGEFQGRVGVFPDNFVETMPQETAKPRKPPPPVTDNDKSKAPERPLPPEPAKGKHKEEERPVPRAAPALPSKKPAAPPPIGKKPKPITDDDKALESEQKDLDQVEPAPEKLTHMTSGRAVTPLRRPPTKKLKDPPDHEEEVPEVSPPTEAHTAKPQGATKRHSLKHRHKSEEVVEEAPPVAERSHKDKEEPAPTRPHRMARPPPPKELPSPKSPGPRKAPLGHPMEKSPRSEDEERPKQDTKEPHIDPAALASLRNEIADLKANSVSREQYEETQSQLTQLKDQVTQLKNKYDKRIRDLMDEVDEEKKTRLNMQVEIDRLKKLVD